MGIRISSPGALSCPVCTCRRLKWILQDPSSFGICVQLCVHKSRGSLLFSHFCVISFLDLWVAETWRNGSLAVEVLEITSGSSSPEEKWQDPGEELQKRIALRGTTIFGTLFRNHFWFSNRIENLLRVNLGS